MGAPLGIAFLQPGLTWRLSPARARSAILASLDMRMERSAEAPFDADIDLSEDTQLTILTGVQGLEIWCGFPVAYMVERMHQISPALPKFTGLFIAQDEGSGTFLHQGVQKGRYGPGLAHPVGKAATWSRTFLAAQGLPPQSATLNAAFDDLAADLGTDADLLRRATLGMSGAGFRGLAWHADKGAWVLARSLAERVDLEPSELIELNPKSYAKRGKPFAAKHTQGAISGFLRQPALIYEVQHRAIAAHLGTRLDTTEGLARLNGRPALRHDLWLSRTKPRP